MNKVAVVVFSNLDGSGLSAVYRALMFVDELQRSGDDVTLLFDGSGSAALAEIIQPGSELQRAWTRAASALRGACGYCAASYGVKEALEQAGVPMLADDRGHASLRALLLEGRQIVTF